MKKKGKNCIMVLKNDEGLLRPNGSVMTDFNLAVKASRIKCDYNIKTKLISLLGFIEKSKILQTSP